MTIAFTSEVDINIGIPSSSIAGNIVADINNISIDGTCKCKFYFHKLNDPQCLNPDNVFNTIYPVILNTDNSIDIVVHFCLINLTQQDLDSVNLESIIYNKVADKLNQEYGWSVVVA